LTISQIFLNLAISTHFSSSYNQIIFWPLNILNIGCTRAYEMHFFVFFCFQTFTWDCIRELCSPNPCLELINLCWFQKIVWWCAKIFDDMSWNILPHHLKFATLKMNILIIFHDMAWNIFKYSCLFTCSPLALLFKGKLTYKKHRWT